MRTRTFIRDIIEHIIDSSTISNYNITDIETISSFIFLKSGDYLMIECEENIKRNCEFLMFYKYMNKNLMSFIQTEHICQRNDYPKLFEFVSF